MRPELANVLQVLLLQFGEAHAVLVLLGLDQSLVLPLAMARDDNHEQGEEEDGDQNDQC
jgi:hypothetical protein